MATPMRAKDTAAGMTLGSSSRSRIRDVVAPMVAGRHHELAAGEGQRRGPDDPEELGAPATAKMTVSLSSVAGLPERLDHEDGEQGGEGQDDEGPALRMVSMPAAAVAGQQPERARRRRGRCRRRRSR